MHSLAAAHDASAIEQQDRYRLRRSRRFGSGARRDLSDDRRARRAMFAVDAQIDEEVTRAVENVTGETVARADPRG